VYNQYIIPLIPLLKGKAIMSEATIFNIQKFCVNDGPGIRTTVFFKGCPLNCVWCHNPESKKAVPEVFYNESKCIKCGKCMAKCGKDAHSFTSECHIYDREKCIVCGECCDYCPTEALEVAGYKITVEEALREVMKDKVFYDNSGGGLTVSGGEPMMQFEFVLELMKRAKEEGLHTCMETCGFADAEKYRKIAEYTDIFLFDYKITDPEEHKKYTGVSNEKILSNLFMLDDMGKNTVLRCPIIPTVNDTDEHLAAIAKTANKLKNVLEVNIEPYHPLGSGKSEMLGKDYVLKDLTFPEEDTVKGWIAQIQEKTSVTVKKA